MTQEEREKRFDERFDERFSDEEYRELLGSYADHAPAYTHPEGECTCCPMEYWHIDDIFPAIKQFIQQEIDLAVANKMKAVVEMIEDKKKEFYEFEDGDYILTRIQEDLLQELKEIES